MIELVEHYQADEIDSIHVFDTLNAEGLKHTFSDRFPKDYFMMTDWGSAYEQIFLIYKMSSLKDLELAGACWLSHVLSWEGCAAAGFYGGYLLPGYRGDKGIVGTATHLFNEMMHDDFGPNFHLLATTNVHNVVGRKALDEMFHYAGMVNNFDTYNGVKEHAYVYSYEHGQQALALALAQLRREHHGLA